ncbi:MAG: signal peptidase II [Bryobacterales bacterium]
MDQPVSSSLWRRKLLYLGAAAGLVALDQWTKALVAAAMPLYSSREIIPGFFRLVHTRNTGIAFSLLADSAPLVRNGIVPLVSAAAVALVVYLLWNSRTTAGKSHIGLCLILAGAVGNLYDRAAYGYVVDFLDFFIAGYHWPAFNVADSCITIGAGLVLADALRNAPQESQEAKSA